MAEDRPEEVNPDEAADDAVGDSEEISEVAADETTDEESNSDPLAEAASQIEELKDQALRAQAEMENVRRRAVRDVENAHKYALDKFTADLLPVLDSLEKALEASTDEGSAAEELREGVELSLKLFISTCGKAGITKIDPHGEPFDPQLQEAIAMVPNPDAEPNSVMEVMQKGYTLNGRLVRAAKVVVVSAGD